MEFFKTNTQIPFMRLRKSAAVFSIVLILASLLAVLVNGLNFGLDFTGGTELQLHFDQVRDVESIRHDLSQAGFPQATVQLYGNVHDVTVRVGPQKMLTADLLKEHVQHALPTAQINSAVFIGPQVGQQLVTNGILAIIVSLLGTMIYIALRFEYRFAVSAAIALIHDPLLIIGLFAYFHWEFNLIVLTALLTVIGYSLNDTIVVYDRIRENFRKMRKGTPAEIVDLSINQTLSRTLMTSGMTLVVVVALFVCGGEMLRGFALAFMIGIAVGTYSSIYIAGALAVVLGLNRNHLLANQSRGAVDELP